MSVVIRQVEPLAGLRWLRLGWQDFRRAPLMALLHGFALLAAMLVIIAVGYSHAALLAGAFSGFVLVAPILLTGMYAQSRALSRAEPSGFATVSDTWRRAGRPVVRFGLLLALVGSAWVLCSSLIVMAANIDAGGIAGYLQFFAGKANPLLFWLWLLAGGLLAALVFAASAVSLPMLIDQSVSVRAAITTSVEAVGNNPAPMVFWAVLIMLLTMLAVASVVGLTVLMPVLGHATWHAYRDLVQSDGAG